MDETYLIGEWRIEALDRKLKRLNKRAVKLGLPTVSYDIVAEKLLKARDEVHMSRYVEVAFRGDAPVVGGHTFIGRVEHTEAGNIVSKAPGAYDGGPDLSAYRTADNLCEHCGLKRARKDTFVLQGPDGSLLQVGRSCLADYCRSPDVSVAIALWTLLGDVSDWADEDSEREPSEGGRALVGLQNYVACAFAAIRQHGWTSRAAVRNDYTGSRRATADDAMSILLPPPSGATEEDRRAWRAEQPTDEDTDNARAAIAWAAELTDSDRCSDYESNLAVACALDYVDRRNMGLVASVAAAYLRHVDKLQTAKRDAATRTNEYYGEAKARVDLVLTVTKCRVVEGYYGLSTLVMFEDGARRTFKWFASGEKDFGVGDTVSVRGTIKAFDEYRSIKQTVLTRCRVSEEAAKAA